MNTIEVRPVRPEDEARWDDVARSSDDAWLTHSWNWNVAIEERVMGGESKGLVILRDGRLIGIVPQHLHTYRRGPFVRRILYSNYWAGGGVALANEVVGEARAECFAAARRATQEQARRDRVDKLMVFLPPLARHNLNGEPEARRALDGGFVNHSSSALVVRLAGRSKEQIWAAMEGRGRTKARKAERAGVCVTRIPTSDALKPLYELHLATCKRTGASPYPLEYFEETLATGYFHVFLADIDRKHIGALTLALYDGRALFDVSASTEEALRLGSNNLLIWRALEWLVDAGAEAFELGVVPAPHQPVSPKLATIAWHHRSFGGDEVPAYRGELVFRRGREAVFALAREALARMGRSDA